MSNNKYTDMQLKIISGEIPMETVNGRILTWLYKKSLELGDGKIAERVQERLEQLKSEAVVKNRETYPPEPDSDIGRVWDDVLEERLANSPEFLAKVDRMIEEAKNEPTHPIEDLWKELGLDENETHGPFDTVEELMAALNSDDVSEGEIDGGEPV